MNRSSVVRTMSLAGVLALAVSAPAAAHPSMFDITAKTVANPSSPPATQAGLVDQQQYVVVNHGNAYVVRESNGATNQGLLNYKWLPGAYRNQPGFSQSRKLSEGDTGAQPHATCRGAAALDENVVLAWQTGGDHGNDPFYNYVPWQATGAGLDDDPAQWLEVVRSATGVNLAALSTPQQFADACAGQGGMYAPADATVTTANALNSSTIAAAVAPLEAQVKSLTGQRDAADAARRSADSARAAAEAATTAARQELSRALLTGTRLTAKLDPARFGLADGTTVRLTGPALQPVTVKMVLTAARAKRLGLKSRVIGQATATIGADATTSMALDATPAARRALRKLKAPTGITFQVTSGDRVATTTGLLSR